MQPRSLMQWYQLNVSHKLSLTTLNSIDQRLHIVTGQMFYAPVSIGTSMDDKLIKICSDSISDSVIFQGEHAPDFPSVSMLHMFVCFARYESIYSS